MIRLQVRLLNSLMILSALLACGPGQDGAPASGQEDNPNEREAERTYTDISVQQLQEMMSAESAEDLFLVNTHVPFEGDIPGTDESIRFDEIGEHLDRLPQDRDAAIVLYCRSDRMSREAAETLTSLGFSNVFNLDGGFRAWQAAGLELEMGSGRV